MTTTTNSHFTLFLPVGLRVAQPCRYCFYSQAQKWVFRPAGATQNFEFWPEICTSGATRLQYFYEILSVCTRL